MDLNWIFKIAILCKLCYYISISKNYCIKRKEGLNMISKAFLTFVRVISYFNHHPIAFSLLLIAAGVSDIYYGSKKVGIVCVMISLYVFAKTFF